MFGKCLLTITGFFAGSAQEFHESTIAFIPDALGMCLRCHTPSVVGFPFYTKTV